jgi:hypothetical protein
VRDLARAWERWQAAAGPWQGWSMSPLLLAHDAHRRTPREDQPRTRRAFAIADELAASLRDGGSGILLDLEPVLGVHVAAQLNERQLAHAVVVIPRWPYAEAVLPTDELIGTLIAQSKRLSASPDLRNVAFVLDAQRNTSIAPRPPTDSRADNRYRLAVVDLPSLAQLRASGIQRVLKVMHR